MCVEGGWSRCMEGAPGLARSTAATQGPTTRGDTAMAARRARARLAERERVLGDALHQRALLHVGCVVYAPLQHAAAVAMSGNVRAVLARRVVDELRRMGGGWRWGVGAGRSEGWCARERAGRHPHRVHRGCLPTPSRAHTPHTHHTHTHHTHTCESSGPSLCRQRWTTWLPFRSRMRSTTPPLSAPTTSWTCGAHGGEWGRGGGGGGGVKGKGGRGGRGGKGQGSHTNCALPSTPTPTCSREVSVSMSFCTARVPCVFSATAASLPSSATALSTCMYIGHVGCVCALSHI